MTSKTRSIQWLFIQMKLYTIAFTNFCDIRGRPELSKSQFLDSAHCHTDYIWNNPDAIPVRETTHIVNECIVFRLNIGLTSSGKTPFLKANLGRLIRRPISWPLNHSTSLTREYKLCPLQFVMDSIGNNDVPLITICDLLSVRTIYILLWTPGDNTAIHRLVRTIRW